MLGVHKYKSKRITRLVLFNIARNGDETIISQGEAGEILYVDADKHNDFL